jgi:hypothetical protein
MPGENKLYLFLALRERSRPYSNPGETSLLHGQVARSGRIRFSLNTTAVESFYRTASSNDFFSIPYLDVKILDGSIYMRSWFGGFQGSLSHSFFLFMFF